MTSQKTAPISISIQGADSAHYRDIAASESHVIRFPDGITRLITMPRWYWRTMHWLVSDSVFTYEDFIEQGYQLAVDYYNSQHSPFETELRNCFELIIRQGYAVELEDRRPLANENSSFWAGTSIW